MMPRRAVLGLIACALAMRLAWLMDFRASPLFEGLLLDERNYDVWAQRIAGGDVLGEGTFTANPLAPYVLGLLYAALGRDLLVVRLVQMLAATATCFLVYRLSASVVGSRAALAALALSAFYGPTIFVSGTLVAEVWVLLFAAGSLALLTRPNAGAPAHCASGLLLALGALGRPNLLPLLVLLPVAQTFAVHPPSARWLLGRAGAWFVGAALVLGPVLVRNATVGGDAVLVTAHGGVNLWIGNNPDADGFFKTPVGSELAGGQDTLVASSIEVAEEALGHPVSASEASRWWTRRAVAFAVADPLAFLRITATKAGYFLNAFEAPLESNYDYARTISPALRLGTVGFGVLGPLSIVGIWLARRQWRAYVVLLVFVAAYSGSVIATFVAMRYRLPVVLGLLPFAGLAVSELVGVVAVRRWREAAGIAAAVTALTVYFHRPLPDGIVERNLAFVEHGLGEVELEAGRVDVALGHFQEAVRLFPTRGKFYNNLGLAYLRADRPEAAVEALEEGIDLGHRDRRIFRNLGAAYRTLGRREEALAAYERAVEVSPRHADTWFKIGTLRQELGRAEDARAAYLRARALTAEPRLVETVSERLEKLGTRGDL